MAKRQPGVEYRVVKIKKPGGQSAEVTTLDAVLYAPDGSKFTMPYGGDVTTYIRKGYKLQPDADWNAAHDVWKEEREASLKVSNFQRDAHNRKIELKRKEAELAIVAEMEALDDELKEQEAALQAKIDSQAKPKSKAKAKANAEDKTA